jgi:hypothetical protein
MAVVPALNQNNHCLYATPCLQVRPVARRELLAGTAAAAAALFSAAAAQAAGESSATRAITAVNRPQQVKKK